MRGFDRAKLGVVQGKYTLSLDGGCGRGGALLAALLTPAGETLETFEV